MTQPPNPDQLATTEEIHAAADEFVNTVLTDGVSRAAAGADLLALTAHIGFGLLEMDATPQELTMIAARALARLAGMHHAAEQLADQWAGRASVVESQEGSSRIEDCAAELRKLVDDHG
jgi:hypothetical protein